MTPLAICVVYLVTPDNEALLDLHLARMTRHTRRPFVLYASANRLAPSLRRKLEENPAVRIVPIPDTPLRGSEEHAHYLDRLVDRAVADGAEYVAIFHADAFPVRDGWDEELIGRLTSACPVAAVTRHENLDDKPNPCGMLFGCEFYRAHRPSFRLSETVRQTGDYKAYKRAFRHVPDSGVGYGFVLFRNGLTWHKLERSNRGEDHFMLGSVYADMIFHLGAAARTGIVFRRNQHAWKRQAGMAGMSIRLAVALRRILPVRLARARRLGAVPKAVVHENREAFTLVRDRLLADPEAYLHFLRTGESPPP